MTLLRTITARFPARALGDTVFSFAVLTLIVYFAYAALQGNHGMGRLIEVEQEARDLEVTLARLQDEAAGLTNRTRRLSDDFLDLDLLDERARHVLGYARPDEIVIR